jgi:hypothetical protein
MAWCLVQHRDTFTESDQFYFYYFRYTTWHILLLGLNYVSDKYERYQPMHLADVIRNLFEIR